MNVWEYLLESQKMAIESREKFIPAILIVFIVAMLLDHFRKK